LTKVEQEYAKYRQEKEIEDLLVVKFEIESIDQQMLTSQSTQIEDLEREKLALEGRIAEISQ
jgi:hypothetical protein